MADDVLHHSHLRMRVIGNGNLDIRLIAMYQTLPEVDLPPVQTLIPYPMQSTTSRFSQFNANFESQYTQIEISTNVIDEFFYITRIVTYIKQTAVAYPM